jgi:hypothetical protein
MLPAGYFTSALRQWSCKQNLGRELPGRLPIIAMPLCALRFSLFPARYVAASHTFLFAD